MYVLGKCLTRRNYAQFHLDSGQSDFNLHTCPTCGANYAPGEEQDEKEHKTSHKNYTHGIPFKVLRYERVIHIPCNEGGRVVLVLDSDPPAQRNKVQDVIRMIEIELGGGWMFHKLCKRVAGCVVEPIKEAFVLSCTTDGGSTDVTKKDSRLRSTTLRFGEIIFRREAAKKAHYVNSTEMLDQKNSELSSARRKLYLLFVASERFGSLPLTEGNALQANYLVL